MKKILVGSIVLFLLILVSCLIFEYQPHYDNSKVDSLPSLTEKNNTEGLPEALPVTNDLSNTLSEYKEKEVEKFFREVREDDYDFGEIEGDYRQKIIDFYDNGYYYNCWKILNEYAQFTNIKPEKDGKDKIYYKLELVYVVPKSTGYCKSIINNYDGTLKSIEKYVDVMYATSNIQIYKESNYVSIDENFYEFLIMECNLEKRYSETIVMRDYQITLDRNPY